MEESIKLPQPYDYNDSDITEEMPFLLINEHDFSYLPTISKELKHYLIRDYSKVNFQDKFIRPLTLGFVHFTEINIARDNICEFHKNQTGTDFYCLKYFRDKGPRFSSEFSNKITSREKYEHTRETGATDRYLSSVICEGAQLALKFRESNNKRTVLPPIFDIEENDDNILLHIMKILPNHIICDLDYKTLLSLMMTCRTTNNIVCRNSLIGFAIRLIRNYGYLVENKNLNTSLFTTNHLIIRFLKECFSTSNEIFTLYARKFNNDNIEIIEAYDSGDATVISNPQANGDSFVSIESRKLFCIKTKDSYYNIALILKRDYTSFRHGKWENNKKTNLGNIVSAKNATIGKLEAKIEIMKLDENFQEQHFIDLKGNNPWNIRNYNKGQFLKLLSDVNFSHKWPGQFCLPLIEEFTGLFLSFQDLILLSGMSKNEISKIIGMKKRVYDRYYYEEAEVFHDLPWFEQKQISYNITSVIRNLLFHLANIAFGESGSAFVRLLTNDVNINNKGYLKLPLAVKETLRFSPKEWPNISNITETDYYNSSDHDDDTDDDNSDDIMIASTMPYWYQLFTSRDTINKGSIVFEN
jgi:hypothetical protein